MAKFNFDVYIYFYVYLAPRETIIQSSDLD